MNKTVGRKPNFKTVTYSSEEMGLITKARRRGSLAKVPANPKLITYQQSGNFTKCVIAGMDRLLFGVAKRNPEDRNNEQVAKSIAFYRAITSEPVLL